MSLHVVIVEAIGRFLLLSAGFPFSKIGVINDVNQTAGNVLLSKLKVKNSDNE
jgi:hypothetical protein